MTVVRLRLLEGFALEGARSAIELTDGMQRLLALLALHGPMHRRVVAGTLWPEVPEAHALASLRTVIWRLGRVTGDLLRVEGSALAVRADLAVDSREQEAFTTQLLSDPTGRGAWIPAGVAELLRGDLLPGWYDDWVVVERDRLRQLRLHGLERTASILVGRSRLDEALLLALEAVRTEPLRESANRVLIAVFLAEGNVSDAVNQHDAYCRRLRSELGLEPSPRLIALLESRLPTAVGTGPWRHVARSG